MGDCHRQAFFTFWVRTPWGGGAPAIQKQEIARYNVVDLSFSEVEAYSLMSHVPTWWADHYVMSVALMVPKTTFNASDLLRLHFEFLINICV